MCDAGIAYLTIGPIDVLLICILNTIEWEAGNLSVYLCN